MTAAPALDSETLDDPAAPMATAVSAFERLRRLGEGGMSEVWLARRRSTGETVAIKVMKERSRRMEAALVREARLVRRVRRHPNVVAVRALFREPDGGVGLVMDPLEGEPLESWLHSHGALPLPEVARLGCALASALGALHAVGIVHRDVKPANVFLVRSDDGVRPVLLDFGVATCARWADTEIIGTPGYMAPEQLRPEPIDSRVDVFALGVLLFECLTGRAPFEADDVVATFRKTLSGAPPLGVLLPGLPHDVANLVDAMLATDREARLVDLSAIFERLARWAGPEGMRAWTLGVASTLQATPVRVGASAVS